MKMMAVSLTAHAHRSASRTAPPAGLAATPVIPAGRLPSVTLRARLLWDARVRLLVLLAGFA